MSVAVQTFLERKSEGQVNRLNRRLIEQKPGERFCDFIHSMATFANHIVAVTQAQKPVYSKQTISL